VITRVPVLIGEGIPLFGPLAETTSGPLPRDITLHHVATRSYPGGLVQSEYKLGAAVRKGSRKKAKPAARKKRQRAK
jgi:hypothetical protein